MLSENNKKNIQKKVRARRTRRKLLSTARSKIRLCVKKTNRNLYAILFDDLKGCPLTQVSTLVANRKNRSNATCDQATALGKAIATWAKENNIDQVVFDKGASKYHGQIAALASAARENGLNF